MINPIEILTKIPGLGGLVEKAPQAISDFLDKLLEESRPLLDPKNNEVQIFYIMFPDKNKEYVISIVAADEDDKILRSIKSIMLKDALSIIFNSNEQ